MQIASRISDLEPEDAAGCVHLAFEGMPKSKREETKQHFIAQMVEGGEEEGGPE